MSEEGVRTATAMTTTSHVLETDVASTSMPIADRQKSEMKLTENASVGLKEKSAGEEAGKSSESLSITTQTSSTNIMPAHLSVETTPPNNPSTTAATSNSSRINKNDALQYLEQVRNEFSNSPETYNRFLEIMKDFKAQAIDTQTVIDRVTQLFIGHPHLIEGFNSFLPAEHRIRVTLNSAGGLMNVSNANVPMLNLQQKDYHHPTLQPHPSAYAPQPPPGIYGHYQNNRAPYYSTTSSQSSKPILPPMKFPNWPQNELPPYPPIHPPGMYPPPPPGSAPYPSNNYQMNKISPYAPSQPMQGTMSSLPPSGLVPTPPMIVPPPASMTTSAHSLEQMNLPGGRKPSLGMIQAVSYLKKIQDRFSKSPEIYQSFVDILKCYQKEQKHIKEVYAAVTGLFAGHPDLLEEFAQFIPDNQAPSGPPSSIQSQPLVSGVPASAQRSAASSGGFTSRLMSSGTTFESNKRLAKSGGTLSSTFRIPSSDSKRRDYTEGDYPVKRGRYMTDGTEAAKTTGELEFFSRVKRFLSHNEEKYSEFMRIINWYCQDIIKKGELVRMIQGFIGKSEELFNWFKDYIGFSDLDTEADTMPNKIGILSATEDDLDIEGQLDLSSCKRIGSYRFYPKDYVHSYSSGKNPLCDEVLNYKLVSCPSFNSEDSTFVSSKKNQYEEALFRCEDERYEMDRLIDANQLTISNFEPLAKRITMMTPKEAEKFTLEDSLGGTSDVIYRNVIQKIYGFKGDEVIQALKKTPAIAVPIVLRRLKQKDEEWRLAQREWNKVWRDVHFKNYYKALDNQGLVFKNSDKRTLAVKSLVNEIVTVYYEQIRGMKDAMDVPNKTIGTVNLHLLPSSQGLAELEKLELSKTVEGTNDAMPVQLEFKIHDWRVWEDLMKLLLYETEMSMAFTPNEKKSLEKFLLNFIPELFSMKVSFANGMTDEMIDLDKDGLKLVFDEMKLNMESVLSMDAQSGQPGSSSSIIYGNDNIYALFRLLQISYHRLEQMKAFAILNQDNPLYYHKKNYIASFFELQKRQYSSGSSPPLNPNFYLVLVELLAQAIDGTLDSNAFEERIRLMFGPNAYLMFTFEKLLFSLLKQAIIIFTDPMSEHLIALYDSYKRPKKTSLLNEYSYQVAARALLGNDKEAHLFKIESRKTPDSIMNSDEEVAGIGTWWMTFRYDPPKVTTGPDGSPLSSHEKWLLYIDQFVDVHYDPTLLSRKPPLLMVKYLKSANPDRLKSMKVEYNLKCKICMDTFKLFYVHPSEDFIVKLPPSNDVASDRPETELPDDKEITPLETTTGAENEIKGSNYPTKCVERFRAWLEQRQTELSTMTDISTMNDDTTTNMAEDSSKIEETEPSLTS